MRFTPDALLSLIMDRTPLAGHLETIWGIFFLSLLPSIISPQPSAASIIQFVQYMQGWALAVFSVREVVFNTEPKVLSSENSLLLGKD